MSAEIKSELVFPSITIVTINFNDCDGLERTMNSVFDQDYVNYHYLIVDGQSTDGSIDLINSFQNDSLDKIIEKDVGLYHAMNKAIGVSESEWLLFMNAGDTFFSKSSLSSVMTRANDEVDAIYTDWVYLISGKKVNASKSKMNVRHQSIVYRRKLHDIYGTYIVSSNLTISDYIFFLSISELNWYYHKIPLSICDETGVSSKVSHFFQRIGVDYIFNRRDKFRTIFILIFYPIYRILKKIINYF
jgi:glycosyltransferase involved in cell wall biosynthesis